MASDEIPGWLKRAFAVPNALYRYRLGRLLGHRFVQLTHVGRRSGRTFSTVVEVVHYDRTTGETFVVSGFGHHSDWLLNVQADGGVKVSFGGTPRTASYRIVPVDEAAAVFAGYERRNRLLMLVARPLLTRLAEFDYRSTDDDRRRLVEVLPMIALRPA
ncbi:nitroreductase family deazaflavin-dependent oxidoreductase [Myceligenerans pegani]|uniref:Nitroreductase family deazaflavin-dependent oxidoreductase n=1 Tax=Myceligenerans pegani TaxID=2776917 RepID=A0ABR9MUL2_9MICO|nr:nitroreductase family deazaflavin-dependent oxidoreductase [Myceligenerans sp. TRM 65318]MBE1875075.1 nitroreductase family deazaflavin-dependent oxidoreductase [Myceligenerans sp. TRM 65318]MBE3017346.1 nitroreductase family deazaflavin-dependent oxidoreductase [Myceligenerans sp. TRM 65318]